MKTTSRRLDAMSRTVAVAILVIAMIVAFQPGGFARRTLSEWMDEAERRRIITNEWSDLASNGPALGAPRGNVATVMFVDYLCAYCRMAQDTIAEFLHLFPMAAVTVRQLPNPGSRLSRAASAFALCGHAQGQFQLVHNELIRSQDSLRHDMGVQHWAGIARHLGLDEQSVVECMQSQTTTAVLAADADLASRLSLQSTPAFVTVRVGLELGVPTLAEVSEWAYGTVDRW